MNLEAGELLASEYVAPQWIASLLEHVEPDNRTWRRTCWFVFGLGAGGSVSDMMLQEEGLLALVFTIVFGIGGLLAITGAPPDWRTLFLKAVIENQSRRVWSEQEAEELRAHLCWLAGLHAQLADEDKQKGREAKRTWWGRWRLEAFGPPRHRALRGIEAELDFLRALRPKVG